MYKENLKRLRIFQKNTIQKIYHMYSREPSLVIQLLYVTSGKRDSFLIPSKCKNKNMHLIIIYLHIFVGDVVNTTHNPKIP
jgi:hypothetical protein